MKVASILAVLILLPAGKGMAFAQPVAEAALPTDVARRFSALVTELNATRFEVREHASQELDALTEKEEIRQTLADAIDHALNSTELNFEARSRLSVVAKRLPQPGKSQTDRADRAEIENLIAQLSANEPGVRAGSEARLKSLVAVQKTSTTIMLALKEGLLSNDLDTPTRAKLRMLLEDARGAWLTSDPASWDLPAVADEQIENWIEALAQRAPQGVDRTAFQEVAQNELTDLLARDEYLDRVRTAIEKCLERKDLDLDAVKRLEAVHEWTKPAMVAEFWQGYQHLGIQHLLVDVPSVPEGGVRASHFDRIDDEVAHCVSGNTLSPGDYPVGVFFPHPQQGAAQFHLVNLPTPRRRLAYEYSVRTQADEVRGGAILRRTLDRILADGQLLSNSTILMLEELDDGSVSEFTGPYLMKVDDSAYMQGEAQFIGNLSRHQNLCCMLARNGSHQALPGLLAAIKANRFLSPVPETPYVWPWIAVLSITVHDPWPEADEFLSRLLERTDPLVLAKEPLDPGSLDPNTEPPKGEGSRAAVPDVGATAAAILLSRNGIPPSVFGLEAVSYSSLASLDCPASHFREAKDRQRVLEWWRKQHAERAKHDAQG